MFVCQKDFRSYLITKGKKLGKLFDEFVHTIFCPHTGIPQKLSSRQKITSMNDSFCKPLQTAHYIGFMAHTCTWECAHEIYRL